MEFILAPLILIAIVIVWAAQEDMIGPHAAEVLILIELGAFVAWFVWSMVSMTGPHTFIGKWLQARQERIALERAVGKDLKNHNNPHH